MPSVAIAGVSTRAAADSAARAGYVVTAIDAFADLDQSPGVGALSMRRDFGVDFSPRAAARAAAKIDAESVMYLSSFENSPAAVRALARGRRLLGNSPAVLARVRHPGCLAETLKRRGFAAPSCHPERAAEGSRVPACGQMRDPRFRGEPLRTDGRSLDSLADARSLGMTPSWLLKPNASGGGHGIRAWNPGEPVPRRYHLQEHVDGTPGSVLFVAAGGQAVPIGLTRQLIGDPAFGAHGYGYCGNVLLADGAAAFGRDGDVARSVRKLTEVVAREFDLVGANGIDFVARDGTAYPIEVNPRYTAAMELVERAYDVSVFGAHAAACLSATFPDFDLDDARRTSGAHGKAIVFARHDIVCGDTREWLGDSTVRDVPHPGEHIEAGRPVCTVFAEGTDFASCYAALVRRANAVYDVLESWATVAV